MQNIWNQMIWYTWNIWSRNYSQFEFIQYLESLSQICFLLKNKDEHPKGKNRVSIIITSISHILTRNKYIFKNFSFYSPRNILDLCIQFSLVQLLTHVWLFPTPRIAARQAPLSITISQSSLKLTSIESVMPSSHLILCCPLLLLPPVPPSIRDFSTQSTLRMSWPKYWSFSFSIIPSKEIPGLISVYV